MVDYKKTIRGYERPPQGVLTCLEGPVITVGACGPQGGPDRESRIECMARGNRFAHLKLKG